MLLRIFIGRNKYASIFLKAKDEFKGNFSSELLNQLRITSILDKILPGDFIARIDCDKSVL